MNVIKRVEIILEDGTRRRGNVDTQANPITIESAKYNLASNNPILKGSTIVCSDDEMRAVMLKAGFNVVQTYANEFVYSVRLPKSAKDRITAISQKTGLRDAAVIREAVLYWLSQNCPITKKTSKE